MIMNNLSKEKGLSSPNDKPRPRKRFSYPMQKGKKYSFVISSQFYKKRVTQ